MSIINSEDYTFNINNSFELEHSRDHVVNDNIDAEITEPIGTPSLDSTSSISDMDVPISQLMNNGSTASSTGSSDTESVSTMNSVQLFQVQDSYEKAVHVMFTQMSAHKGIKLFSQKAIAAMMKILKQLNDGVIPGNPVIKPIPFEELTAKDKKESLEAVNLIAQKRSGKIKGRTCANGRKQQKYLRDDENYSSPTASLESIMTTLVIDAYEGRDIAIADVPGAYLHAEFPENKNVILRMTDIFVDIMCEINEEYKKHIVYEINKQGKKIKCLYVKVLRALYGCLESAFLWYELYSSTHKKLGFVINPYDRCVANKMINGSQCTILFYVDDNKISHVDKDAVTNVINDISKHFGELTVSRGTKHDFLGMDIEIKERKVFISMKNQIVEAIEWGAVQSDRKPATPAADDLFLKNDQAEDLSIERSDNFHSIVQKLLYICKRGRPDIEPALPYLCTRVSKPTIEDEKKLFRVLGYLADTLHDEQIIGADSLENLYMWVDASYATHPNMRSHTGGAMSFGIGILHGKFPKQKLNTKSSTEAELVAVSDYIPYHTWMINF